MIELLPVVDPARTSRRLDPLSAQLQLVQEMTGADVLLESWDGEVVAHALGSAVSSTVCAAVLTRSSGPLRAGLRESRKVALAAAGAVRAGLVDGQTATVVPVPSTPVATSDGAGRLWLLGPEETHVDSPLQAVIVELGALATRLSQVQEVDVSEVIRGKQGLPSGFTVGGTYLLVARADVPSGVAIETLRRAARNATDRLLIHVGVHQGTDVAVICGGAHASVQTLTALFSDTAVPHGIRCVLTSAGTSGLAAAFHQARSVLGSAPVGCSLPEQLRSRVFVTLISRAVGDLDLAGDDPVAGLVVSHPDFARALLMWLDTHGDVAAAATSMACHVNTVRYRVRRAGELLPGELRDPAFRLEVHLRLLAALHEQGRT